jgi:hypothetical protein
MEFGSPIFYSKKRFVEMSSESTLKVFIGYDPVEIIAWHTAVQSLINTSSIPLSITPVNLENLKGVYAKKRDGLQSNEFSFSRFLIPHLMGYDGYALFMDCDMMIRSDVAEVFEIAKSDPTKAVHVVKHDYVPKDQIKYLGNKQYSYPRKNWSSFVVWNCGHVSNKKVTKKFVNESDGSKLHRFSWLDDSEIGELGVEWNWLVGEYSNPSKRLKNIHWTLGGPYFNDYKYVEFADEWSVLHNQINYCKGNK